MLSLIFSFIFVISPAASANDEPVPPEIDNCLAYCLYDITHDRTLVLEGGDKLLNTSTSAKVMMGLLACEMLEKQFDEAVIITEAMLTGSSGYCMGLEVGDRIKIKDLLYAAICGSYNDAAYVLAYTANGSANDFVSAMNSRAKTLGAISTHYTNPIGFPDDSAMVTTVSDTLKIAVAASKNKLYMEICSAKHYRCDAIYNGKNQEFYNKNQLISSNLSTEYFDPDCSGMNAGMSGEDGGWSIITVAHDDGADYICILLGAEDTDGETAYGSVGRLVDWCRKTYNNYLVFPEGHSLGKVNISLTAFGSTEAEYILKEDLLAYIPDHSSPDLTYKIELFSENIKAPVAKGEELGRVLIYSNGRLAGEGSLISDDDYEANGFMTAINNLGEYTKSRAFIATAVCFILLLTASVIISKRRSYGNYKHRHR